MASYSEKKVYDWSDPAQLNDWDVVASGSGGTATIVNGKLILAPSRGGISGINIVSKQDGYNAFEIEFSLINGTAPANLKYFDISIGSGAVADDKGVVPGTEVWHQALAISRSAFLQENSPTGYFMREYPGGTPVTKALGGFVGSPNLATPRSLLAYSSEDLFNVHFDGAQFLSGGGFATSPSGKIHVHQGWYQPSSWGADAAISKITLYKNYDHYGDIVIKNFALKAIPANQEPRSQFQPQDVAWRGTPPLYPGPVNLQQQTQTPLCKGRDYFWIRDGVRNVEQGYIESTVTISGVGVRRRVLCFTQDGELVGETYSRASDGVYRFDLLWLNKRYMLVAQDDPAFGPADYNAVAADYQAPKPYPPGGGVAPAPFPMLAPLKRK
jgi:hypothetical protein